MWPGPRLLKPTNTGEAGAATCPSENPHIPLTRCGGPGDSGVPGALGAWQTQTSCASLSQGHSSCRGLEMAWNRGGWRTCIPPRQPGRELGQGGGRPGQGGVCARRGNTETTKRWLK